MKLSELLSGLCVEARLVFDTEIKAISEDSRKCYENSLFVCIEGEKLDGHGYIGDAYSRGARCFAVSRKIAGYDDCNIIFVENTRKFLAEASFFLYLKQICNLCAVQSGDHNTDIFILGFEDLLNFDHSTNSI